MIEISPDVARLLHNILIQQNVAVNTENFAETTELVARALAELAPALEEAVVEEVPA